MGEFDIIVVGAGFGGPIAAKICAEAGLKTLLIERSENVGDKVISGLTIPFYGFLFGPDFIRDGNPPIERPSDGIINYIIKDIETLDIKIDDSLKVPLPFSPIFAFGYNTYCKPFCEWETKKAIEAGAELRTSTTIIDVIKEEGITKGIITENGDKLYSKIVIDAEGSQGLLAIKAGVRKKYPPEAISLADTYDYVMPKDQIDKIFGYSVKMCWGWDEQKLAPPLGYGNGLMVWPYRNSLHFMQDQCLRLDQDYVPNLKKNFIEFHKNITSKLPWWRNLVAPQIKLRARIWEGFEIYVGLDKSLRNMPNYTDGMLLIGDAAGLESTELCDGVPAAWFSAEVAANIAIEAVRANDTSKNFLKKYSLKIRTHPLINWSITGTNRFDLRIAQKEHNFKKLKKYVHNGWGLGSLTHFTTPFFKLLLSYLKKDPKLLTKWIKMYFRYYQNWLYECYDYSERKKLSRKSSKLLRKKEMKFLRYMRLIDSLVISLSKNPKLISSLLVPLSNSLNNILKKGLPIFEPFYSFILKLINPISVKVSKKLLKFVEYANPLIFKIQSKR
jgi:electron transfer flavoprotein-quinone oxidoreductase